MLFNSLIFVAFIGAVYPLWRLLPLRVGPWIMLAASLVFYGWWSPKFLALLVATTTLDWALARGMEDAPATRRKALVITSITANLGTLAVFKYYGFFARELDALLTSAGASSLLPALELALPIGISFYTFQAMSYTIDVYRGRVPVCRSLPDLLLYITFFPHLVAGPIVRFEKLMPQLRPMRRPTADQLSAAAWFIAWGFFKKVVVADNLAPVVAQAFDAPSPGGLTVLLGAYAFTLQIYCDFSGYSDIALGIARLFGVELTENFRRPFLATSPRELWRRWHISLSEWLRDYLYVPLGGGGRARNLILTMLLGGLWHGANWTFLVWGLWHGVALALGRVLPRPPLPRALLALGTFHITMLGFVFFRAHDVAQVGSLTRALGSMTPAYGDVERARLLLLLAAPVMLVELVQERFGDSLVALRAPRLVQAGLIAVLTAAIAVMGSTYAVRFIYFQF